MRKTLIALSVAGLCAGLSTSVQANETGMASMHSWRLEGRKTCLVGHYHTGTGAGATKRAARKAAVADWRGFTSWEYGSSWASFNHARSKSVRYTKSASGWEASLDGRPCNPRRRR